jgi:hypothetical protein
MYRSCKLLNSLSCFPLFFVKDEHPLDAFSGESGGGPYLGSGLIPSDGVVVFTVRHGLLSMRGTPKIEATM